MKWINARQLAEQFKFMTNEKEIRRLQEQRQEHCSHRAVGNKEWSIGLQHGFPDYLVRGICLLCGLVIHPPHWGSDKPNQVTAVPGHPLYAVVIALDKRDYAFALLRDVFEFALDAGLYFDGKVPLGQLDFEYTQARWEINEACERETAAFFTPSGKKSNAEEKIRRAYSEPPSGEPHAF